MWATRRGFAFRSRLHRVTPFLTHHKFVHALGSGAFSLPTSLDSVVHQDLLMRETPNKIVDIWREYHASRKETVAAIVPSPKYDLFKSRTRHCPMFVMPLARGDGFITLVMQHQDNRCLVTDMESFQRFQHLAPTWVSITHYEELSHEKQLVLMRGEVDLEKMTQVEAKVVSSLMHTFYLQDEKFKFVQTFNKQPRDFNFDALLADLQITAVKRSKDDDKAERTEWVEDELERRQAYDAKIKRGDRDQSGNDTPWNIKEDDQLQKDKLRELWKF